MSSTAILIGFAVCMWLLQILLGWRQIRLFNQAYAEIAKKGKVVVGRNEGRFTPKAVIVLAVDNHNIVQECLTMRGFSVFAKPAFSTVLTGKSLTEIQPEQAFPNNKALQNALKIALIR